MSVAAVWLGESLAGSSGEIDVRACRLERASSRYGECAENRYRFGCVGMVDQESRWSVSTVCKFGLLDGLETLLGSRICLGHNGNAISLLRGQYAWILYRPWKIIRGYS
jgi:hypothetical protein